MFEEMTALSPKGSYIILNYSESDAGKEMPASLGYMNTFLQQNGWTNDKVLKFGDDEFNYGRFFLDKPTDLMGFAFYTMN